MYPYPSLSPSCSVHLGVPLGEDVDELAVDGELAARSLRHFHVGAVEPEVGGVVPAQYSKTADSCTNVL